MTDDRDETAHQSSLDGIYDAATDTYFAPWPVGKFLDVFDPHGWADRKIDNNTVVAILDTGVLSDHPLIAPRLRGTEDFTGEGPEDRNGHGSKVALMLILRDPSATIISGKVLGQDDPPLETQLARLAQGVHWAVKAGATVVELSVGLDTPCNQQEPLCAAVRAALDNGVFVVVAAEARCPAECDERIIVAGEVDPSTSRVTPGSRPTVVVGDIRAKPMEVLPMGTWRAKLEQTMTPVSAPEAQSAAVGTPLLEVLRQVQEALDAAQHEAHEEGSGAEITVVALTMTAVVTKDVGTGGLSFTIPFINLKVGPSGHIMREQTQIVTLSLKPREAVRPFTSEDIKDDLLFGLREIRGALKQAVTSVPPLVLDNASVELNFVVEKSGKIELVVYGEATNKAIHNLKVTLTASKKK